MPACVILHRPPKKRPAQISTFVKSPRNPTNLTALGAFSSRPGNEGQGAAPRRPVRGAEPLFCLWHLSTEATNADCRCGHKAY
jgi:hypothetical protein